MITLTWKVDQQVQIPCPDYKTDPYTGEYPSFHCLVYHSKIVTKSMTKEFDSIEEAEDFANKAPFSCYDFCINGRMLKDTREKPTYHIIGTNLVGDIGDAGTITIDKQ